MAQEKNGGELVYDLRLALTWKNRRASFFLEALEGFWSFGHE